MKSKWLVASVLLAPLLTQVVNAQVLTPAGGVPNGTVNPNQGTVVIVQGQVVQGGQVYPGMGMQYPTTTFPGYQAPNPANAGTVAPGQVNLNYYYTWCNRVTQILTDAGRMANSLYSLQRYAEAKNTMVQAFNNALAASTSFPGVFRPQTYQELLRSKELIDTLEMAISPSQVAHDKAIAYVALNRVDRINRVSNTLDRAYVIPCAYGCGSLRRQQAQMQAFESTLVKLAKDQLTAAQNYSSIVYGRVAYPLVDASTYFTIISKAAQWTAMDLSYNLFSTVFSCAIIELSQQGSLAQSYQMAMGDPRSVQIIHGNIDALARALDVKPYGCNVRYPRQQQGHGGHHKNSQQNNDELEEILEEDLN